MIKVEEKGKLELLNKGFYLPLMEEFYTIQGEGFHTGTPAYFIRTGGCDIGCHWCDVKDSWKSYDHPLVNVNKVVINAIKHSNTVVVTGGEPLIWNMDILTKNLNSHGVKTHIETSGAYKLSGVWDWICLSPKKTKLPLDQVIQVANELKVIVYNNSDFTFAKEQAKRVSNNCKLYIQPEWSQRKKMIPIITKFIMNNPKWRISLQTHKYMNIK